MYLISPLTSQLRTASRKVATKYVGPLVIYKIMTIDGKLLRRLFEHKRLKPAVIKTDKGSVTTLTALKRVMNLAISLSTIKDTNVMKSSSGKQKTYSQK